MTTVRGRFAHFDASKHPAAAPIQSCRPVTYAMIATMSLLLTTTSVGVGKPTTFGSIASGSGGRWHSIAGAGEIRGVVSHFGHGGRHESERGRESASNHLADLVIACILRVFA